MAPDGDRLEALDALGTITWSGTLFRHTGRGRDPLSGWGAREFGGRWNPAGLVSTIYLATTIESCRAEFERMADRQARGVPSFLPRPWHTMTGKDLELVDLIPDEAREVLGLTDEALTGPDWTICQEVGQMVHFLGWQGLIAPSATGVASSVVLFEPRLRPAQLVLVQSSEWTA